MCWRPAHRQAVTSRLKQHGCFELPAVSDERNLAALACASWTARKTAIFGILPFAIASQVPVLRRTRQHPQTQGSGVQVATQQTTILHSAHVSMTNICNRPIARRRCCQQSAEAATERRPRAAPRRPAGRTWWRPARTTAAAPWTAAAAGATSCSASSAPLCKSARRYCQVRAALCVLWRRRQQLPSFAMVCDGQQTAWCVRLEAFHFDERLDIQTCPDRTCWVFG